MFRKFMGKILVAACLLGLGAIAVPAIAADYPDKPIQLVSPYGAGGDSDLTARVWAEFAKAKLGQPVVVVNKTGGGGLTGSLFAARAKADGYTLFLGQAGPNIIIPLTVKGADYSVDSFDYIARVMVANCAVVTSPDAPWKNLKELEEAAKKEPGKYIFASPAATSWLTFAMRSWLSKTGIQMKIVEYKSGGEAAAAIMGGHAHMTFLFPQNYASMASSGKVKILAIGAKSEVYPNAPTFAELGYVGNYYGWGGITAPKGTPKAIIDKLTKVCEEISKDPEFIKGIKNMQATPDFTPGDVWVKQIRDQYGEMKAVLSEMGLAVNK